ncbi:MAG: hypothetical protein AB1515_10815, partial [Nitrospirota bacterium]
ERYQAANELLASGQLKLGYLNPPGERTRLPVRQAGAAGKQGRAAPRTGPLRLVKPPSGRSSRRTGR